MAGLIATAFALVLAILPFGGASPIRRDTCEQPYYEYESAVAGTYIVTFFDGYTLAQHLDYLKTNNNIDPFDVTELSDGYYADIPTDTLTAVRSDCSVYFVEDDVTGSADEEEEPEDTASEPTKLIRRGTPRRR